MRPSSTRLAAALLSLLAACAHRAVPPTAELDRAAARAETKDAGAHVLALAGLRALLLEGDIPRASSLGQRALEREGRGPWAHYLQLQLSRRAAQPAQALEAALSLLEAAPSHPLASVAGRAVLDAAGMDPVLDDALAARGQSLLASGKLGADAAHLLRSALVNVALTRGDAAARDALFEAMGTPGQATLLGPLAAWGLLDVETVTGPAREGAIPTSVDAPAGKVTPRTLPTPGGRLSLQPEPVYGDLYVLAFDVEVPARGAYVLRTQSASSLSAWLDGTRLLHRRTDLRVLSSTAAAGLWLEAGHHRVVLQWVRDGRSGELSVALSRADGAPAGVTFVPATGPAPAWSGVAAAELQGVFPDAGLLARALEPEVGEWLAAWVATRDGLRRDADGVKPLLSVLARPAPSPAVQALQAEATLQDRSLPARVSHGRAARDLDAALERDRGDVAALLLRAQLALDDGRLAEATELSARARAAAPAPSSPVALFEARVQLSLGLDGLADERAAEAAHLPGGRCEGTAFRLDLARKREAVAQAEERAKELSTCPGHWARQVELLRTRGDLAGAVAAQARLAAGAADPAPALSLAALQAAARDWAGAEATLRGVLSLWPRMAQPWKRLGDVYELSGRMEEALHARDEALLRDGTDLSLRRAVHHARTGKELLDEFAITADEAFSRYAALQVEEEASTALVLDAAAVRVYPDGTQVDRIHLIQKALDSTGVQKVAEVNIPEGAQLLALHTWREDGTRLEPERFEHKETVSLPGVRPGDSVEYEYLLTHPPRGPGLPGFTAPSFYFRVVGEPNAWTTYTVAAPAGSGMTVDARQVKVEPPFPTATGEVFHHEETRVPPWLPEPDGPASPNEFLPVVTVGTGATGLAGVATGYADGALDRAQRTHDVDVFAAGAAAGRQGEAAVRAVYAAVMARVSGPDAGLGQTAAATLAEGRGSRTLLLKAALESLGFEARLVAVRTSSVDPGPVAFPDQARLPYACVRVTLPGGTHTWLDPLVRYAPFGLLPEQAMGGREAHVLPEPGRPLERTTTPAAVEPRPKRVTLTLELAADGTLSGTGEEKMSGFEAAQFAESLDSVPPEQRRQALEQALSRYFGGAELSGIEVDAPREVGAELALRYRFVARGFARREGQSLVVPPLSFPGQLGRRFLQVRSRQTPLVLEGSEAVAFEATLVLPERAALQEPLSGVSLEGPLGHFERSERQEGRAISIHETMRLRMGRVPPADYEPFAVFVGQVDLVQARELLVKLP